MATFSKITLSGSTDGRGIAVDQTAIGTGTTIHTASSTATTYDEVWLYASNTHTAAIKLTVGFGGTTDPNDLIEVTVQPEAGLVCVAAGLVLKGNATPLVVKAAAGTANEISLFGFVNRITA